MQVIRRVNFKSTPWKNGGGVTHEALRVPAESDLFHWRVSVAQIDRSGPFSDFAGYHRSMLLLQGMGVHLTFSDGVQSVLKTVGEFVQFDGAMGADCQLLDGPCVDLNLMVSKSLQPARVWVEPVHKQAVRAVSGRETLLLVSVQGDLTVQVADSATQTLGPWDLGVVAPREVASLYLESQVSSVPCLVFFAALEG